MSRAEAIEAKAVDDAVTAAIGAIRRRERTISEVREWLLTKGSSVEEAEEAVARLVEVGELDDERFARAFAADKRDLSGWGSERIGMALSERGVEAGLVERAIAEPREDELDRATELLLQRPYRLDDDAARARALGFLTRRGYGYELAHDAIRQASAGVGSRG